MAEKSSQSDLSTVRLLESGKAARRLLDMLDSTMLSGRQMGNLLAVISRETSTLKSWIYALSQIENIGARQFMRNNPTGANAVGLDSAALAEISDELGNDSDPWMIPKVRQRFCDDARIQFHLKMSSLDQLSQLGAMCLSDDRDSERWESVNPLAWTAWGKKGSIATILGPIKSGKTNLSLLLAEYFLKQGYFIASNVGVTNAPPEYRYTSRLSDMLTSVCEARKQAKHTLIILDEAGLYWNRAETLRPTNLGLAKLLVTFGKLDCSLLLVTHYAEMVAGVVHRNSVATFQKRGLREVFVEINDGIRIRPRLLVGVPSCSMTYNPDQLQFFSLDLSVPALFDYMSSLSSQEDQWSAVLRYVQSHVGEADEDLSPKEVAQYLRRRGLSEGAIAKALNKSGGTIHLWVAEEKKVEQQEASSK